MNIEPVGNILKSKACTKCLKNKPTSEFDWRKERANFKSQCRSCLYDSTKKYRLKNIDKVRSWYKNRRTTHRDRLNSNLRRINYDLKLEVLSHYTSGKIKCQCPHECNILELEFMSIDHINNDGARHRKELKVFGSGLYRWLKKNNYPDGFRVLCMNCNTSLGFHGYCPHRNNNNKDE
jgi:hypothetical protein